MKIWNTSNEVSPKKPIENFKVIFIGDCAVGKTSIIQRYLSGKFSNSVDSTIGASFSCSQIEQEKRFIKLHIWDTAGQERYRAILNIYFRDADVAILVCDLNNKGSIESLETWIENFREKTNNEDAKIIIVANKLDLLQKEKGNDVELPKKLIEISNKYNYPLITSSALSGTNISEVFDTVYENFSESVPFNLKKEELNTLDLQSTNKAFNESFKKHINSITSWCNLL